MSEFSVLKKDGNDAKACNKLSFTSRELQCLTEIMENKSLEKTAQALTINPRTLYFYLVNIQYKINVLVKSAVVGSK